MTFYFYDLETSGFNARQARIMQFAGQRTTLDLKPIGNPDNILIKLTPDVLPDPQAILVTGITPQKTLKEGLTEAEFVHYFDQHISRPDTIFTGFNNIRFDDEFMRHTFYRNFYDPYEWQWQDGRSRWDLLDVSRMTRALRPEGIKWPFDSSGAQTNQLGLLASVNKLLHKKAHDALSDVLATIELAVLIRKNQPKLFDYMLKMRTKVEIKKLVNSGQPFLYTSGKYASETGKTTAVTALFETINKEGAVVYDLRYNPSDFLKLSIKQLAKAWLNRTPEEGPILPVKTLKYNRCPAVAPLSVLDAKSAKRLGINSKEIKDNSAILLDNPQFIDKLKEALLVMDKIQQERFVVDTHDVDLQLYEDFFSRPDKLSMQKIRRAEPAKINAFAVNLKDKRLKVLLPLYKARNYAASLTNEELQDWLSFCRQKLTSPKGNNLHSYFSKISELRKADKKAGSILGELEFYGQSRARDLNIEISNQS